MSLRIYSVRMLTVILLVLLLVSCGQQNRIASTSATTTPSPPTAKSTSSRNQDINFRGENLQISSKGGIQCENHIPFSLPSDGGNLVLATDRLKYDSAEMQQMQAYVQTWYDEKPLPALPSTLTWAPAGNKLSPSPAGGFIGCYGELIITNIGSDSIQIQSLNIRLTSASQKSEGKQYRLIDICSLLSLPTGRYCTPQRAGPGPSYDYYQLSPGEKGKVFSPQALDLLKNTDSPLGINTTLSSNEATSIDVLFDSSQNDLIYSVMPELLLVTSSGQQTVALPQLATTLYFVSQSLFPCYSLRGDTFVQVPIVVRSDNQYCL